MEKNKPISVAFEDIRNNPDFIEHSEYRFINDDLGMVISFQAMGFRLFRTQQPYRFLKERIEHSEIFVKEAQHAREIFV